MQFSVPCPCIDQLPITVYIYYLQFYLNVKKNDVFVHADSDSIKKGQKIESKWEHDKAITEVSTSSDLGRVWVLVHGISILQEDFQMPTTSNTPKT